MSVDAHETICNSSYDQCLLVIGGRMDLFLMAQPSRRPLMCSQIFERVPYFAGARIGRHLTSRRAVSRPRAQCSRVWDFCDPRIAINLLAFPCLRAARVLHRLTPIIVKEKVNARLARRVLRICQGPLSLFPNMLSGETLDQRGIRLSS